MVVRIARSFAARGLSCAVGDGVKAMLDDKETNSIGHVILSHISKFKRRSEERAVA